MPINLDQQAKIKALQALKNPSGSSLQSSIMARRQAAKQQGASFLQGQQEMDPQSDQSEMIRQEARQSHPELANHPEFNKMSGEQIKQQLQYLKENQ